MCARNSALKFYIYQLRLLTSYNLDTMYDTLNPNKQMTMMAIAYFMAQQPLKSFDRPQMRVSLSNSIFIILIFY